MSADPPIAAIVLAAGASSRMGRPKQTLAFAGTTLLRRAAESVLQAGCSPVIVVLGAVAEAAAELTGLPVQVVHASDWSLGMGASLHAGLAALPSGIAGVLLTLCDMPLVDAAALRRLIDAHRSTGRPVIAAAYAGTVGVPALFDISMVPQLASLPLQVGAKKLLAAHADQLLAIELPQAVHDVDTPADYERVKSA